MKYVEDILSGEIVRVPRKTKKQAKRNRVTITARMGKHSWLAARQIPENC